MKKYGNSHWDETTQRFEAWWKNSELDRPMIIAVGKREAPTGTLEVVPPAGTFEDKHMDPVRKAIGAKNALKVNEYFGDAFNNIDIDLGPGSLATYLGCEPEFSASTVWFKEFLQNGWQDLPKIEYDPNNKWWVKHLEYHKTAKKLLGDDALVCIPDIIENFDILSAMRGTQDFLFDMIDEPEEVHKRLDELDNVYFEYYDRCYDVVKEPEGGSAYAVFSVWGPGRTCKVQCDISAMMSPSQFDEYIVPSLTKQCEKLDSVLYHLDGPDALRHVDSLMKIDGINCLQWTAGAGKPDGGDECWFDLYDKVRAANKGLWVKLDGPFENAMMKADRLQKRYGNRGLFFYFPRMTAAQGNELMLHSAKYWEK